MNSVPSSVIAGKKLRQLIIDNYKSQEEFAEKCFYDLRTVNRYINEGINRMSTIDELAALFGIEPIDFFRLDT